VSGIIHITRLEEAVDVANDNDSGSNLFSLVGAVAIGAAVGAATALLLAPKSGAETREDLKEMAGKAKVRADELAAKASETMDGVTSKVSETMDELKSTVDEHFPRKDEDEEAAEEA
jgi:gas vesicle protein